MSSFTYYVTRDSRDGVVVDDCDLWYIKPVRHRQGGRVVWVPASILDAGHLGQHPTAHVLGWFGVYSETDLELIRVVQGQTEKKA